MISLIRKYLPMPIKMIGAKLYIRSKAAIGQNYVEHSYQDHTFRFKYVNVDSLVPLIDLINSESGELTTEGISLSRLSPNRTVDAVIDVGAHFGIYSVLMGVLNPKTAIVAYEPSSFPRHILKENLRLNGLADRALISNAPIMGEGGNLVGFTDDPDPNSQSNEVVNEVDKSNDHIRSVALSDVFNEEDITHPFLKIDAEGQEENILADLIERADVSSLSGIVELHPDKMPSMTVESVESMVRDAGWTFKFIANSSPGYKWDRPLYYFAQD